MELGHGSDDEFLRLDRAACETSAILRHRSGALALAQVDGIAVRPLPARVALHAWAWAEMAGEARAARLNDRSRRLIGDFSRPLQDPRNVWRPFERQPRWVGSLTSSHHRESQPACAPDVEPASVRRPDSADQNAIAMGAPQYCTHRGRIKTQGADGRGRVAGRALDLRDGGVKHEDLPKKTRRRIGVEHEISAVVGHDAYPPEGPNRSVLMRSGSCPSSTRNRATSSTKGVGPQTKILGFCAGGKHISASSARSILPRRPVQPIGCWRVRVWTTRRPESRRAMASSSWR